MKTKIVDNRSPVDSRRRLAILEDGDWFFYDGELYRKLQSMDPTLPLLRTMILAADRGVQFFVHPSILVQPVVVEIHIVKDKG